MSYGPQIVRLRRAIRADEQQLKCAPLGKRGKRDLQKSILTQKEWLKELNRLQREEKKKKKVVNHV